MTVLIIDGQGGNLGRQLVKALRERLPAETELIAVGTNSIATANMMKGGDVHAATGENAVIVNARRADCIVGPLGMVIADSLYGEITAEMALAVSRSRAKRILIPVNRCDNTVVGVADLSVSHLIAEAAEQIAALLPQKN